MVAVCAWAIPWLTYTAVASAGQLFRVKDLSPAPAGASAQLQNLVPGPAGIFPWVFFWYWPWWGHGPARVILGFDVVTPDPGPGPGGHL